MSQNQFYKARKADRELQIALRVPVREQRRALRRIFRRARTEAAETSYEDVGFLLAA